jgi:hypothetical protein
MQQPRAANREGISRLPAGYRRYSVTIELPLSAETFEAELKEDDQGVLWLHEPNRVSDERMGSI